MSEAMSSTRDSMLTYRAALNRAESSNMASRARTRWVRRALLAIGALVALVALWAFWFEPRRLVVRKVDLRLPAWPSRLAGLRVALLADLHVGSPYWDLDALTRLVERTNAEGVDLVLLGGDYQINGVPGGTLIAPEPIADQLAALRAQLGVFAVLCNHDWWNDGERTRRALESRGITVLEDTVVRVQRAGLDFYLLGLADQITRPSDPRAVFARVPAGAPTLLLVHEPDVFDSFPSLRISPTLTLAGHTHGGQVWLPLIGSPIVPSTFGDRYACGHIVENDRHLFVTTGIGTSILPVRFLVPPEVVVLTLR